MESGFPNAICGAALIDRLVRPETISINDESHRLKEAPEPAARRAAALGRQEIPHREAIAMEPNDSPTVCLLLDLSDERVEEVYVS